tara:strand:+ start:132 stop:818 length:687 start_codon:yes stop_codon:yes gene_type:complete
MVQEYIYKDLINSFIFINMQKNKQNPPFIGLAGNIGVGKTTFTKLMCDRLSFEPFYESVQNNPYLDDFYTNMRRWGFNLQIYFLYTRFKAQIKMDSMSKGIMQDRTIYEDKEIFAWNLYKIGKMSKRDWRSYCGLFSIMVAQLRKPDLIIYLKATTDTLLKRIKTRGREYEKSIDLEYLHTLNLTYERWINSLNDIPVLIVDTNDFNVFNNLSRFYAIEQDILRRLNE